MDRKRMRRGVLTFSALAAVLFVAAACSSDEAVDDQSQEVADLQARLAAAEVTTVVQAGQLVAAAPDAAPSGWDTAESIRGGLQLVATYDSSGPDAWDPAEHPTVYFASEGGGYGHRPSQGTKLPGVQVIDSKTREVVASALFDLGGEQTRQPHGLGVSPDGQWVYIGFAYTDTAGVAQSVTAIVNARTLKLDKVLRQESSSAWGERVQNLHHTMAFTDFEGNARVLLEFGFGATGGPHFLLDPNDDNRVVRAITYDEVRPMGHPYVVTDPTGRYLFISMGANWIRESEFPAAAIAKLDLSDGSVVVIEEVGAHPIGQVVTPDGKFLYVADGTNSRVYKIDLETNEVVGHTSSAVAGPYGLRLNWDSSRLYVMGKGEGTHNVGGVVGVIDLKTFRAVQDFNQPIQTGGAIIDHAILNPDPELNEMWISSAGTWETIILDLDTNEVKDRIPSPNGGDTHSGAFVRYDADFGGELLADHANPQAEMFATMRELAEATAAR